MGPADPGRGIPPPPHAGKGEAEALWQEDKVKKTTDVCFDNPVLHLLILVSESGNLTTSRGRKREREREELKTTDLHTRIQNTVVTFEGH